MRDFNHSVAVLTKAYFDNTLLRGDCFACAVGNIVCDSLGMQIKRTSGDFLPFSWGNGDINYPGYDGWGVVFITNERERQRIDPSKYIGEAKRQIDATGYTWQELASVEKAFEKGYKGKDKMFNALMAVVDVLADIHGIDLTATESAKALFVKA